MGIGAINLPRPPDSPIGFSPFSAIPTAAAIAAQLAALTNVNTPAVAPWAATLVQATLTSAQVNSGSSSPPVILAAPGAGLRWIPLAMMAKRSNVPNTNYSANPSITCAYANAPATSLVSTFTCNLSNVTGAPYQQGQSVGSASLNTATDSRNQALVVKFSADTTGNGPPVIVGVVVILVTEP